jgi:hypothetical protein
LRSRATSGNLKVEWIALRRDTHAGARGGLGPRQFNNPKSRP